MPLTGVHSNYGLRVNPTNKGDFLFFHTISLFTQQEKTMAPIFLFFPIFFSLSFKSYVHFLCFKIRTFISHHTRTHTSFYSLILFFGFRWLMMNSMQFIKQRIYAAKNSIEKENLFRLCIKCAKMTEQNIYIYMIFHTKDAVVEYIRVLWMT